MPVPPFARRYTIRLTASMVAYGAALVGSNLVIAHAHPTGVALVVMAVLPSLPILVVLWTMGLFVVEMPDEYQRMRMVQAMLFATAILLAVLSGWSFLQDDGVVPPQPAHLAFPLWCAGLGLGQCGLALRERWLAARA